MKDAQEPRGQHHRRQIGTTSLAKETINITIVVFGTHKHVTVRISVQTREYFIGSTAVQPTVIIETLVHPPNGYTINNLTLILNPQVNQLPTF